MRDKFKKGADAAGGFVEKIGGAFDKNFTSKHEKLQEKNKSLAHNKEDRMNARDMYKSDSWLQKWWSMTLLAHYMVLTYAFLYIIYTMAMGEQGDIKLPEWGIALVSTIWGGATTKIATITDFMFGSSKTAEIQERKKRK